MLRSGAMVILALLLAGGAAERAAACEGTETVFEDKFTDDAGGWTINQDVEVKDGSFVFKLPPDTMQPDLNVTFTVKDADICAETVWPTGDPGRLGAGLLFWGEDGRNFFQFGILNNGKYWVARKQDGKWHVVVENVTSSAINTAPGATNTLRVKTTGSAVSFFVNGTKLRDLRGQAPDGSWRFGLSGDNFDKEKDARLAFKSVKVTN
jgi:hypothetical protein